MLDINVKDIRELNFEMDVSGVSSDQLEARLRIVVDNIEYGIPAKITSKEIQVEIPPLKRLVQRELQEGETFEARLDVFGEGYYLKPWTDSFKVHNPVVVEAKLKGDEKTPKVKVSVSEKKKITKHAKRVMSEAEQKLSRIANERQKVSKSKPKKKPMFESKEHFKKKLTKEQVMSWLERNGTKNPKIQEIMYEQAEVEAGSDKPYKIMLALAKVLKK